ncbi:MAG TPA: SDR family oxidoreductase [Myxococcota bacterium]|nr:SDR family oxidoreductase [Myxococcota bacterium]
MTATPSHPEPPFEDQRALIYGAARGIGRAVALEFARRGAAVAIADIDRAGAEETAQAIAAGGGQAIGIECDVRRDDSVRAAAAAAERQFGDIDIAMNNVGVILSGHPEDIPIAEWERIVDLNLMSAVRSLAVFVPKMVARGRGYIVNTASFAGLYPYATNRLPYAAAKAAVVALSEGLALHLLPKGVRVSCLCPGPVATRVAEGMKSWSADAVMRGPGSQFRLLTPEEVAKTLADGMRDGRVVIPTHDEVFDVMREHAASPDRFIHAKLAAFARGDTGLPVLEAPEGR